MLINIHIIYRYLLYFSCMSLSELLSFVCIYYNTMHDTYVSDNNLLLLCIGANGFVHNIRFIAGFTFSGYVNVHLSTLFRPKRQIHAHPNIPETPWLTAALLSSLPMTRRIRVLPLNDILCYIMFIYCTTRPAILKFGTPLYTKSMTTPSSTFISCSIQILQWCWGTIYKNTKHARWSHLLIIIGQ